MFSWHRSLTAPRGSGVRGLYLGPDAVADAVATKGGAASFNAFGSIAPNGAGDLVFSGYRFDGGQRGVHSTFSAGRVTSRCRSRAACG